MNGVGQLEQMVERAEIGIVTKGSLFAVQLRRALTEGTLARLEAAHTQRRAVVGCKLAMLTIVNADIALPEGELKMAAVRSFRTLSSENLSAATVLGGVGFWASAARSTLTGLSLLARPSCPSKAFGDVASALAWTEAVTNEPPGRFTSLASDIDQWKESSSFSAHP